MATARCASSKYLPYSAWVTPVRSPCRSQIASIESTSRPSTLHVPTSSRCGDEAYNRTRYPCCTASETRLSSTVFVPSSIDAAKRGLIDKNSAVSSMSIGGCPMVDVFEEFFADRLWRPRRVKRFAQSFGNLSRLVQAHWVLKEFCVDEPERHHFAARQAEPDGRPHGKGGGPGSSLPFPMCHCRAASSASVAG